VACSFACTSTTQPPVFSANTTRTCNQLSVRVKTQVPCYLHCSWKWVIHSLRLHPRRATTSELVTLSTPCHICIWMWGIRQLLCHQQHDLSTPPQFVTPVLPYCVLHQNNLPCVAIVHQTLLTVEHKTVTWAQESINGEHSFAQRCL